MYAIQTHNDEGIEQIKADGGDDDKSIAAISGA
jgi:hypothetical protein